MQRSARPTPYADLGPAILDLHIWAGDQEPILLDFTDADTGDPEDLTGITARLQARNTPSSDTAIIDLSIGSGLALDGPAGRITVEIPGTADHAGKIYFYDLEITAGGIVSTYLAGRLQFDRDVSRS